MSKFEPKYISAIELAQILGVSRQYTQRCLKEGKIKGTRISNRWRIPLTEVKRIEKEGIKNDRKGS